MSGQLQEIRDRISAGDIKGALSQIEKLERNGILHPAVLVWKACCVQLDDEDSSYPPSEIESTLKRALEIDNEFSPATIELAWFYLNVLDDAARAIPLFEKAILEEQRTMTEAVIGKAKCMAELETPASALRYLGETGTHLLDAVEVERIKRELEDEAGSST